MYRCKRLVQDRCKQFCLADWYANVKIRFKLLQLKSKDSVQIYFLKLIFFFAEEEGNVWWTKTGGGRRWEVEQGKVGVNG